MSNSLLDHFSRAAGLVGPLELLVTPTDGGRPGRYQLAQPFALIGRAGGNDVALDHPSVSRRHAYLQAVGGRLLCLDLGSRTGVRWADGPRRAGWLAPGDVVTVGSYEVRLAAGPAGPEGPPAADQDPLEARPADTTQLSDLALEIDPGTGRPTVWPMAQWFALAGRGGACLIRAADEGLLPHHCAFIKTAADLWLVDLSIDGRTRVNGDVARAARLKDGDLVRAGPVSVVVRAGFRAPPPAPGTDGVVALPPAPVVAAWPADAAAAAVAPLHDMMRQFQECLVVMARMFAGLQQEQSALARDQLAELQRAAQDLRDTREALTAAPFAEGVLPPPPAAPPAPKPLAAGAASELADAHAWLVNRLAEMGAGGPPGRGRAG